MIGGRHQRELNAALEALDRLERRDSFDPKNGGSKPTKEQKRFFDDIGRFKYRILRCGNQCLAEGTLVRTTTGIKKIEDILIGDLVYDENGNPIKVLKTFSNGMKVTKELWRHSELLAEATDGHIFLGRNRTGAKEIEKSVGSFGRDFQIKRNWLDFPTGGIEVPQAYVLGALLGDGCSREKRLSISGQDEVVVNRVSNLLSTTYKKNHESNFTWNFFNPQWNIYEGSLYEEWCATKYAHEKICNLEEIKKWDSSAKLAFLAGLIDTDGSIFVDKFDTVNIQLGMQAKSVVDVASYLVLELFQVTMNYQVDNRTKYKNGPVHSIYIRNNVDAKRILKNLPTCVESKMWHSSYEEKQSKRTCEGWTGVTVRGGREVNTYDIHVDSPRNLYCLANGLVTHNSGKSTTCARELAWIAAENHPHWKRPEEWGTGPLTLLVAGQDRKAMEIELWDNKLRSYLSGDDWRAVRQGQVLSYVEHRTNGNKIVFLSHSDGSDKTRRHMQGYVAHFVWIDEMPMSFGIFEELQRRIQARQGYMVCSFTPKSRNEEIRRHVDHLCETSQASLYRFSMLDNPLYKDRKKELLEELNSMSDAMRKTILHGDWFSGESAVYEWKDDMIVPWPANYSLGWRHVQAVDPALKSKMGHLTIAEDPSTSIWYVVDDTYIENVFHPQDIVDECKKRVHGVNVVRRISDVAPWFQETASRSGMSFIVPFDKTGRKSELIKKLQAALSSGRLKVLESCHNFINEISSCQWSETSDKIINSQSYHCLDAAQYFCDLIPKPDPSFSHQPWAAELRVGNEKRKKMKAAQLKVRTVRTPRAVTGWGRRTLNIGKANG